MPADDPLPLPSTWGPPSSQLRVRAVQLREADRYGTVLRRDHERLDAWRDEAALLEQHEPALKLRAVDSEPARVDCDGCYRCRDRRVATVAQSPRARRQA